MKKKLKFYKSWFASFTKEQFIPKFSFSKNVQGWFFTRNWCLNWLTYCLQYSITIKSDLEEDRSIAHEKNVAFYMKDGMQHKKKI